MEYKKNDIAKLERLLDRYKKMIAEIKSIDIEIEYIKQHPEGISAMIYEEKSSPTNKFNSSVENEVIAIDKKIKMLEEQKAQQVYWISKIDNAINILNDTEQKVIKMKCFEGMEYKQIGQVLNINHNYACEVKRKAISKIIDLVFVK
ncbi:sigma factor-like helix-turn-helix DNA-binding protein [Clostridium sporogenes]|uniref:sigma factor-like helix-turn-helix DNA-binding protein n=1 Tax=Clostridium sporogenes TaxID=1509 RepID=UPI000668C697|nr:sigma factor-like helix-turn-helix DNA-binding protein [Clostridium sporogenes]